MQKKKTRNLAIAIAALLVVGAVVAFKMKPPGAAGPADAASTPSALTVELVAPDSRDWPQTLSASGAVAAWEEIVVSPETGGLRIEELRANVGDRVAKGQLLARLADATVRAELAKQQALVAQAEASLQQAAGNLRRAQSVDVAGALAPQKLDEYRAAEATAQASLASARADLQSVQLKLAQTRITAPDDGVVASKAGVVGNVASVGTELCRLIRRGRIEWRAELDAQQLALVRAGQSAQVQLPGGGAAVAGTVRLVSPTLNTSTGRGIAYVSLDASGSARAGTFASGSIALQRRQAWTLPGAAVVQRDGRSYVFLVDAEGKAASRPVATGRRRDARVEIVSGIEPTARVVARGGAFLADGTPVTVAATAATVASGAAQ
mgnify:CR=1 FL=1